MKWYKLYLTNLLPYLAVMLLLLFAVFFFVLPNLYDSLLLREMERYQNQITQMSTSVENQLDAARMLPVHIEKETALRPTALSSSPQAVVQGKETLARLISARQTVYSIGIFYRESGRVLTETDYLDLSYYGQYSSCFSAWRAQDIHELLRTIKRGGVFHGEDTLRRSPGTASGEQVICYVAPVPYFSDAPYGAVLVAVSLQSLRKNFVPAGEGLTLSLMYGDGSVVFADHDTGALEAPELRAMLQAGQAANMTLTRLSGEEHFVTIIPSKNADLYYVATLSRATAERALTQIRSRLMLILSAFMVLELLLCAYLSYTNTRPALLLLKKVNAVSRLPSARDIPFQKPLAPVFQAITQLEKERDALETQNSMFLQSMHDVCLSRFLSGQFDTLPEILDLCAQADVRFPGPCHRLLLLQCRAEQAAQSDLAALAGYVAQDAAQCHTLYLSVEQMALIVSGARQACENVSGRLVESEMWNGSAMTVWLSACEEDLAALPETFRALRAQLRQSVFHEETGLFLYPDDLAKGAARKPVHGFQDMLMKALMNRQADAASNALAGITRYIRHPATPYEDAAYVYQDAWHMLRNCLDAGDQGRERALPQMDTARDMCDELTDMLGGRQWAQRPNSELTDEQLADYVGRHLLDDNFSIATASAHFGLSESAFSYQFKRIMGENYLQYVNHMKIARAQALLSDEGNTLESVAEKLGYANASNFSRMFKSITGMTPGQYRHTQAAQHE